MTTIALSTLAARVAASPPRLGDTRLVCVDGPAGSGKTTLAGALRSTLVEQTAWTVPLVHLDDCYPGWTGLDDELVARIAAQILDPLRAGRTARYQRYDWEHSRFAEWHDVQPTPAVLLEGVGSAPLPFDSSISLLIWVEAGEDDRMSRGLARDGHELAPQWRRWMLLEAVFNAAHRTRERADIIVDGSACSRGWPERLVIVEDRGTDQTHW